MKAPVLETACAHDQNWAVPSREKGTENHQYEHTQQFQSAEMQAGGGKCATGTVTLHLSSKPHSAAFCSSYMCFNKASVQILY